MSIDRRLSPHMERIAKQLAVRYGMDWAQPGSHLTLVMPGRAECWLLINLDGERFSLTCCLVEQDETLVPEVDMVFAMHAKGWEPIELVYSNEAFTTYVQAAQAAALPVYDTEGNLRFDTFTEYWAKQLKAQGRLEHGRRLTEEEAGERAESTATHPLAPDDSWARQHTVQLVCDCPEQCGTVLKLTPDGFLILEDRDGLLVSLMLPDWLDFALRRALLVNPAVADDEARSEADRAALSGLDDDVPF